MITGFSLYFQQKFSSCSNCHYYFFLDFYLFILVIKLFWGGILRAYVRISFFLQTYTSCTLYLLYDLSIESSLFVSLKMSNWVCTFDISISSSFSTLIFPMLEFFFRNLCKEIFWKSKQRNLVNSSHGMKTWDLNVKSWLIKCAAINLLQLACTHRWIHKYGSARTHTHAQCKYTSK